MSNEHLIPELAPYWKRLDFPTLLSRPAALPVDRSEQLRLHTGRQAVRRAPRPARQPACDGPRGAGGTEVRQFPVVQLGRLLRVPRRLPQVGTREVQYAAWTAGDDADTAQIAWDNEL